METGDLERLSKAIQQFTATADRLQGFGNNSTITIAAGGVGTWISVTCCIVMLSFSIGLGIGTVVLFQKFDRMQDHLSAIYMMAPQLKPQEKN